MGQILRTGRPANRTRPFGFSPVEQLKAAEASLFRTGPARDAKTLAGANTFLRAEESHRCFSRQPLNKRPCQKRMSSCTVTRERSRPLLQPQRAPQGPAGMPAAALPPDVFQAVAMLQADRDAQPRRVPPLPEALSKSGEWSTAASTPRRMTSDPSDEPPAADGGLQSVSKEDLNNR